MKEISGIDRINSQKLSREYQPTSRVCSTRTQDQYIALSLIKSVFSESRDLPTHTLMFIYFYDSLQLYSINQAAQL